MSSSLIKVESGVQLLARLSKKRNLHNFYPTLFDNGPNPNDVIEIIGKSGTGKTYLVMDITCEAILPVALGGAEVDVLLFTTDGNMSLHNLWSTLQEKILSRHENLEENNSLVKECFNRLHIINVYDSSQFYVTIQRLDTVLMGCPNITLIVFDTLTSFYWSEQNSKIMKMSSYVKNILKLILKATKEFKVTLMLTKPEYFCSNKETTENTECNFNIRISTDVSEGKLIHEVIVNNSKGCFKKIFCIQNNSIKWNSV